MKFKNQLKFENAKILHQFDIKDLTFCIMHGLNAPIPPNKPFLKISSSNFSCQQNEKFFAVSFSVWVKFFCY